MTPTMIKLVMPKTEVLQYENRPYKGQDGTPRQDRSMVVRYQGKMFAFSVDQVMTDDAALALRDKTVDLELVLSTFGKDLTPTFRVCGVSEVPKK